jgi:hypothetical protein
MIGATQKYKAGDVVTFINDYGVVFTGFKIIGIEKWEGCDEFRYFVEPSDTPWYSHKESLLYGVDADPIVDVVAGHEIRHTMGWNEVITDWLDHFVVGNSLAIFREIESAVNYALNNPSEDNCWSKYVKSSV